MTKKSTGIGLMKLMDTYSPQSIEIFDSTSKDLRLPRIFGSSLPPYLIRVHQLENDLITLNPSNFESLNEFFTKFKNLIYQLKKRKVEKVEDQLILSILTKLNVEYSVFV